MAPTRTPFANTQNTLTTTPTAPHRRPPSSHRQSPASPYKKKGQDKAKDALTHSQKKHLKTSDESPIVPRAREYGVPRHLKNVKSSPQHAPFDPRAPPTETAIRLAERKVREQNAGRLDDMLFGREIAMSLGRGLDRVPGRVVFGDDAVRKYCKATGLTQHLTDDERDVLRFELVRPPRPFLPKFRSPHSCSHVLVRPRSRTAGSVGGARTAARCLPRARTSSCQWCA